MIVVILSYIYTCIYILLMQCRLAKIDNEPAKGELAV